MVAVLLAVSVLMFWFALGGIGFVGPDEPRYAGVAREMYQSGDFVTPRLAGETWFEKPVLMYWLAAAAYTVLGIGEAAARLPSSLGATISVLLVFWIGRRLFSRAIGFAAGLILATSIGFLALARAASMDMLLTASLTAAMAFFLGGYTAKGRSRRWLFYLFYAALGFGVLAKGPIAIVLPVLALGAFTVFRGRRRDWWSWHPEGLLVTALVAVPWYAAVTWVHGREFIDVFFLNHNLQRFTSEIHGHPQPFYFYVPVLLLIFFPWSFALIGALRGRYTRPEHLLLVWAAVPLVFFSLSGSKLPAYILPVLPPLALLTAREVARREMTRSLRVATCFEAAFWVAGGVALALYGDSLSVGLDLPPAVFLVPAILVAGALLAVAIWMPPAAFGAVNVVAMLALVTGLTVAVFPHVQTVESMRPWDAELDRYGADADNVVLYKPDRWMEYGLQYYRERTPRVASSEQELIELTRDGRVLCIAESGVLGELGRSDTVLIEVVSSVGDQAAFWAWSP
jgi:4-amino-4-deoxy-L-arabinose transferase-like glycosyltransferase